ncbi:hypothetical protein A4X06_0g3559 [Tilletia controversa]|uniref:Uncharacterized protein n=1 Tax=Tilletia controversa TaxID=13291 RepID=A0A8X7MV35_9BASI|nr:hypothetical protein CF328_g5845 [Tilletia controversa]KAE8248710.1 hypothetical protein A4X06_0g3559 [Tilletia controversa]
MAMTSALNAAKAAGISKQVTPKRCNKGCMDDAPPGQLALLPCLHTRKRLGTRSVPVSSPPPAAAAVVEGEATLAASPEVEAVEQGDVAAEQEDGAAALPANAVHLDATAAGETMPDNNHVDLPAAGADGESALAGRVADDEEDPVEAGDESGENTEAEKQKRLTETQRRAIWLNMEAAHKHAKSMYEHENDTAERNRMIGRGLHRVV